MLASGDVTPTLKHCDVKAKSTPPEKQHKARPRNGREKVAKRRLVFDVTPTEQFYSMPSYVNKFLPKQHILNEHQLSHHQQQRFENAQALLATQIRHNWNLMQRNAKTPRNNIEPIEPVKLSLKIPIPPSKEKCNYIGRILGPCGLSIKRLEADTKCTILIRGVGSVKDPIRESHLIGVPGWEHLTEELHVLIEAVDTSYERCWSKLYYGAERVRKLFTPTFDEYKRGQLIQLAIINGTYRPNPE